MTISEPPAGVSQISPNSLYENVLNVAWRIEPFQWALLSVFCYCHFFDLSSSSRLIVCTDFFNRSSARIFFIPLPDSVRFSVTAFCDMTISPNRRFHSSTATRSPWTCCCRNALFYQTNNPLDWLSRNPFYICSFSLCVVFCCL